MGGFFGFVFVCLFVFLVFDSLIKVFHKKVTSISLVQIRTNMIRPEPQPLTAVGI